MYRVPIETFVEQVLGFETTNSSSSVLTGSVHDT